jgi:hypothetical protein
MKSSKARSVRIYPLGSFLWVVLFLALLWSRIGRAQDLPQFINLVQVMETEKTGLSNPVGLTFSSQGNEFYVVDAQRGGNGFPTGTDISDLSVLGIGAGSTRIDVAIDNPINMTFDNKTGRLLIYQAAAHQLVEVGAASESNLAPHTLTAYDAGQLGLQDPQGMTIDPVHDYLIFLDAVGPRLVLLGLLSDGGLTSAEIIQVDLQWVTSKDLRGIAFDPTSGNLHVLCPGEKMLYELTLAGELVARRDLSGFQLINPRAIIFAPSGDQTDDPALVSLYLADSGTPSAVHNDALAGSGRATAPVEGKIVELSLIQPVAQISSSAESTFVSTLVRSTNMATFSPPSPDPTGLTYISASNTLLMSDGEVEETVQGITHFMGANLWEMSLDGVVVRTANISSVSPTDVPMTNEPTGAAWNPGNGHYYFSDDDAMRVYDLDPGSDGLVGTSDDTWTSFSTVTAGSGDPEGITYDSWHDRLFVVDGVNREVYQFTLSGGLVEHFDVQIYGVADPEGIEFNPFDGTLFILSNAGNRVIIQTTTSGSLLQTIDVSASSSLAPSGLAYAPANDGSGVQHFYIVDRGIDNNSDPNIIDGKMYEMTAPLTFNKISPHNGVANQPLSLTLSWSTSPIAIEYQYCYDTSNDDYCSGWVSTDTSTSAEISDLLAGTTYYWHVRANNSFGSTYSNGSSTAFWSFTTGSLPGDFSKTSPSNGATSQPLSLTLAWGASSGATSYEYCYDTSNDNACSGWVNTSTTTSAAISGLSAGTTYYWHVRANNSFGGTYSNGSGTAFWSFTTGSLPGDFSMMSPSNGAIDQPLSLTLTWEASSGAVSYEYCYDTTDDDTCSDWTDNGAATSMPISGLSTGTTYYWHVRAVNSYGVTYANGSSTAFQWFSISSVVPIYLPFVVK